MKKSTIGSFLVVISAILAIPQASFAQIEEPNDTRIEKYEDLTEATESSTGESDMSMYDVRRTEAFNLVSSGYRGDFEEQGINSYAVFTSNYETGELTAEDLIKAGIEAGDLSPSAMEDEDYINAVKLQLDTLTQG